LPFLPPQFKNKLDSNFNLFSSTGLTGLFFFSLSKAYSHLGTFIFRIDICEPFIYRQRRLGFSGFHPESLKK